MFDIMFLGTAASRPTADRGLSGLMVFHETERFLVDCGEGTQRQLIRGKVGYRKLTRVFLTHCHLDHILGLGGLAASFSEWEPLKELTIYGPPTAISLARRLLCDVVLPEAGTALDIQFVELAGGETVSCDHVQVRATAVPHREAECLAYLFEEPAHRHFNRVIAERLGVPEGPARHQLAKGEAVTLGDGTTILPDDVLGPPVAGTRLMVVGDIADPDGLLDIAADVDGLVIESTYLEADREHARHYGHLTAVDAARFATACRARALYLTHISGRYTGTEILEEARHWYANAVLAEDLMRASIKPASAS